MSEQGKAFLLGAIGQSLRAAGLSTLASGPSDPHIKVLLEGKQYRVTVTEVA